MPISLVSLENQIEVPLSSLNIAPTQYKMNFSLFHLLPFLLFFVKDTQCDHEGFLFRHYSGLCLSVMNGTQSLYLAKTCTERFKWTKYDSLMHVQSGMCMIPESNEDDAKIFLRRDCKNPSGVFRLTANMSLLHIKSSKCLHPYWGCPVPSQGEDLVLHRACNEERLKFDSIKENNDCQPIYPYCRRKKQVMSSSSNCSTIQHIHGLEWHWVYIIVVVGGSILLAQWVVIACIYSKMIKKYKKDRQDYPHFGSSARKKLSLSYNESEDVKMLGITSTSDSTGWRFSEYSDASSVSEDKDKVATPIVEESKENGKCEEKRSYINIDYNKNKKRKSNVYQATGKEGQSRRTSKLAIDFSKMRHVFKVRKSYTLNDLEMLKRISVERHEYEEPNSPCSLDASLTPKTNNSDNSKDTNEYVEPDTKNNRVRSASVPAKMAPPEYYLKPVCSEKERGCGKTRKAAAAYANAAPLSPVRIEKNLYDMPELSLIKEQEDTLLTKADSHTYVKILED